MNIRMRWFTWACGGMGALLVGSWLILIVAFGTPEGAMERLPWYVLYAAGGAALGVIAHRVRKRMRPGSSPVLVTAIAGLRRTQRWATIAGLAAVPVFLAVICVEQARNNLWVVLMSYATWSFSIWMLFRLAVLAGGASGDKDCRG